MLRPRLKPVGSLVFLPVGAASAIIGLLPWLVTGMRLPLQNLWATGATPAEMPVALLPFSQYSAPLIVAVLVIGATFAGVVGRAVPAQRPRSALAALVGGVLLVQVSATVQTAVTVSSGLRAGVDSKYYFSALLGGTAAAILLGLAVLALIARAPRAGALVGLSVAAVAFGSWLSGLFFPIASFVTASPMMNALGEVVRFVPAVIVGLAIAWCGIRTIGRVIAALASLVVLWIGPTFVTAVSAALGSRVLARYPAEMLNYGAQVFRSALGMADLWFPALALAIAVAAVGLAVRAGLRMIGRRSSAASS